jgi:nucleotide-binding universal stress UspA family protein
MMKILIPVDGSENALRAVRHVIDTRHWYATPVQVHLLNVQPPVASGAVKMFISRDQLQDYYEEEGQKALKAARDLVQTAGLECHARVGVGDAAGTLTGFAGSEQCDLIVMGTRGMGAIGNMMLGSVATKVIHLAPVPVQLVR